MSSNSNSVCTFLCGALEVTETRPDWTLAGVSVNSFLNPESDIDGRPGVAASGAIGGRAALIVVSDGTPAYPFVSPKKIIIFLFLFMVNGGKNS